MLRKKRRRRRIKALPVRLREKEKKKRRKRKKGILGRMALLSSRFLVIGFTLFLGGEIHHFLISSPLFSIVRVDTHGGSILGEKGKTILNESCSGRSIFQVDLMALKRELEGCPWVGKVTVERRLPNRIFVKAERRKAVALLAGDRTYGIDEEGFVLAEVTELPSADLPVITDVKLSGVRCGEKISSPRIATALKMIEEIRSSGLEKLVAISEVNVGETGNLILYTVEKAVEIRLGKDNYREKLRRLKPIIARHIRQNKEIEYYDLCFEGKVLVKPRLTGEWK